jgi:hypothetical protein
VISIPEVNYQFVRPVARTVSLPGPLQIASWFWPTSGGAYDTVVA